MTDGDASPQQPQQQPSDDSPDRLPANVRVLGWASFWNDTASEMIFPLLPIFLISELGGNKVQLGVVEGLADTIGSVLRLFSGAWSDRLGKRKALVVAGYGTAATARMFLAVLTAPWQLMAARAVDRIGKGIRTSPRDALIADSTPPELRGRAFGYHRSMDHLGAALGPLLATLFLAWRPGEVRSLFRLAILPGLLVLVLLCLGLREPRTDVATKQPPLRLTLRPFGRPFRIYLLALLVFALGNASDAFLLVRAQELGVQEMWLPILWLVFHLAKSSGNQLGGRIVDRWGPQTPILVGWSIYAAVYLGFACATQAWHAWALFLGYALYYALSEPAEKTLVTQLAGVEQKGLAFGWYNLAVGLSALPASLFFGTLYHHYGPLAAFLWGAALAFSAMLVFLGARRPLLA